MDKFYCGFFFVPSCTSKIKESNCRAVRECWRNFLHDNAQCCLGYSHQEGEGTEKNFEEAVYWFHQAIEKDNDIILDFHMKQVKK